jgi:riboflavin synthase
MFTGIVHHVGKVIERQSLSVGVRLTLSTEFNSIQEGESISIDGACLTAVNDSKNRFTVDVSPETLTKTNLENAKPGTEVNLERALCLGDALGGHWVTGHVDTIGHISDTKAEGPFEWVRVSGIPTAMGRWLIPKGSVTVNGVSLTINEVFPDGFSLMLIPHTLQKTNLKHLSKGAAVNIEFDWMVKTVLSDLGQRINLIEEANAEFRSH